MENIDQYIERKAKEDTAEHFAGVEAAQPDYIGTATYSPQDNKIRITPFARLAPDVYERVKAAGYSWAPKQGVFVAPKWTPGRFDLAVELCGDIDDEDSTMEERAEQRAERFEGYSDKRAADADRAASGVKALADGIPLGQPILIGHHSERRARKDAEKIERGMAKAVKMWETSKYWEYRAAGAIAHAKYKEKPTVRARRIKTLGAEMRVYERQRADSERRRAVWTDSGLTLDQARQISRSYELGFTVARDGDKRWTAEDVLKPDADRAAGCPSMTFEQVKERAGEAFTKSIAHTDRWINHYQLRIAYETAMLQEQGAAELLVKAPRPKQPGIINQPEPVTMKGMYGKPNAVETPHPMTKAEYAAINQDYKACRKTADGFRIRIAAIRDPSKPSYSWHYGPVFLTDSKINRAKDLANG